MVPSFSLPFLICMLTVLGSYLKRANLISGVLVRLDLSSPLGASVNEGINPEDYSLQCIQVDDNIKMVWKFGKGALMGKFDV